MFEYPWGTSEDDLTRSFFGLMKYLPTNCLFIPFLSLIQSLYPERNIAPRNIEEVEILPWPVYEIPIEWREQFNRPDLPVERRRSKYYIVPDVVIRFNEYTFVVEAEKSHSVEPEQLFQQYVMGRRLFMAKEESNHEVFNLLINTDQMRPYACHISATDKQTGISISLSDSISQYIWKRAKMLGEDISIQEISCSYLWLSWHHIGKLAEEVLGICRGKQDESSQTISRFLSGFKAMMDREGFYPVRFFRPDDTKEVYVEDPTSIPALRILPKWQDFLPSINPEFIPFLLLREGSLECDLADFEEKIVSSSLPVFRLLPDLSNWPIRYYIQPEIIRVLNKGGN